MTYILEDIKKQTKRSNAKNISLFNFYSFLGKLGYAVVETGTITDTKNNNKKVSSAYCIDKVKGNITIINELKLKPVKLETLEKVIKYYYGDLIKFNKTYCQYAPEIKKAWLCFNSI